MNIPDAFICTAVFALITGSYGFTYKKAKDLEECNRSIKEDLKEISATLNRLVGKLEAREARDADAESKR